MRSAHRVVLLFALLVTSWTTSSWACSILLEPLSVTVPEAPAGGIWWGASWRHDYRIDEEVVLVADDDGDDITVSVVHVGWNGSVGLQVPDDVEPGRTFRLPDDDRWVVEHDFTEVVTVADEELRLRDFPQLDVEQELRWIERAGVDGECNTMSSWNPRRYAQLWLEVTVPDGFAIDVVQASPVDSGADDDNVGHQMRERQESYGLIGLWQVNVWADNVGGDVVVLPPAFGGDAAQADIVLRRLADGEVNFVGSISLLPAVQRGGGCTCTSSSSTPWGLACLPLLLAGFAARRRRPQRASSSAAVAAVMLLVTSWTTSSWACSVNREPNSVTVFDAPRGGLWWGRDLDPPPVGTVVRLTALDDGDDLDVTVVHQGHVSSIGLQVPDDIEVGRRFALPAIFFYEDADNADLALTVVDTAPDDDAQVPPAGVSFESVAETPSWSIRANCGDVGPWYSNGFQAHDVVVTAPAGHVVDLMYGFVDDVDTAEDERFAFNTRNQWLYVVDGGAGVVRHRMRSLNDEFDVLHVRLRRLATGALGPVTTVSLLPLTHYGCTCTSSPSTPWATTLLTLSTLFVACRRGRRKRRHRRG